MVIVSKQKFVYCRKCGDHVHESEILPDGQGCKYCPSTLPEESEIQGLKKKLEDIELRISQAIGFCKYHEHENPELTKKIIALLDAIK